jgi:hypothetical protein
MLQTRYYGKVKALNDRHDLQFISDSQDVQSLKEHFGNHCLEDFDSFFVKIEDGDYTEVYGINGIIPYLYKDVYEIGQF